VRQKVRFSRPPSPALPQGTVKRLVGQPTRLSATSVEAASKVASNLSFSASGPRSRGGWQQRLTLGPGDVLNFSLFGQPEMTRNDILIAPDGRVSYLQAQDILAAGLTVDELRARFDEELGKYLRAPRTFITPAKTSTCSPMILFIFPR